MKEPTSEHEKVGKLPVFWPASESVRVWKWEKHLILSQQVKKWWNYLYFDPLVVDAHLPWPGAWTNYWACNFDIKCIQIQKKWN